MPLQAARTVSSSASTFLCALSPHSPSLLLLLSLSALLSALISPLSSLRAPRSLAGFLQIRHAARWMRALSLRAPTSLAAVADVASARCSAFTQRARPFPATPFQGQWREKVTNLPRSLRSELESRRSASSRASVRRIGLGKGRLDWKGSESREEGKGKGKERGRLCWHRGVNPPRRRGDRADIWRSWHAILAR